MEYRRESGIADNSLNEALQKLKKTELKLRQIETVKIRDLQIKIKQKDIQINELN